MSSQPQVTPEDAVQVAQRALQKVNEQQEIINDLQQRVTELEASQPDTSDYDSLDRDDKVGLVREHLIKRAHDGNGRAAVDYKDVKFAVFDGEPSADHCYTLMQIAGQASGFNCEDPSGGNKRLTVNSKETKPNTGFSHANKDQ